MKWVFVCISVVILIYIFSDSSSTENKNPYEYKTSTTNVVNPLRENQTAKEECESPNNPYDEGSGHYAGFEWESENGYTCDGNSESFNEGCEEYTRQLNSYNACIEQNK